MPVVSITRLRLRSWRFVLPFAIYAVRANAQARSAPGNRGIAFLRQAGNVFWTASLWDSEAAVRHYLLAGAHGRVMPRLIQWCDEASVVRWTQESSALPDWREAHRRMLAEGRRSKVRYPSAAQERFEIPAPDC